MDTAGSGNEMCMLGCPLQKGKDYSGGRTLEDLEKFVRSKGEDMSDMDEELDDEYFDSLEDDDIEEGEDEEVDGEEEGTEEPAKDEL